MSITINDVNALSWKFPNDLGWKVRHDKNNVNVIITWPNVMPKLTQVNCDQWDAEYLARDKNAEKYIDQISSQELLKTFMSCLNDGTFVPGKNYTDEQIKNIMKVKL